MDIGKKICENALLILKEKHEAFNIVNILKR